MSQARILTSREYRKVLVYIANNRHASRNKAMLYASHLAGLRVGEISHLTIADVLNEDGTIKDEVYLCAEKTKGDRGRTVLMPKKLQEELHNYLSIRFRLKDLKAVASHFRGNKKFGRTTKLVNVRTGETFIECMGACTKGELHIAFLKNGVKVENLDASVRS